MTVKFFLMQELTETFLTYDIEVVEGGGIFCHHRGFPPRAYRSGAGWRGAGRLWTGRLRTRRLRTGWLGASQFRHLIQNWLDNHVWACQRGLTNAAEKRTRINK